MRDGIANLRAAWAAHPDDEDLNRLIDEFLSTDEDFARLWTSEDVEVRGRGRKVLNHPEAGTITLDFEMLTPVQDPDQRVLLFRPANDER